MNIQDKQMLNEFSFEGKTASLEPDRPKRQKYVLHAGVYYVLTSRE
jgi:hypothetical protein